MNCKSCCQYEMEEAYMYQRLGFCIDFTERDGHLFFIAFTEDGEIVAE